MVLKASMCTAMWLIHFLAGHFGSEQVWSADNRQSSCQSEIARLIQMKRELWMAVDDVEQGFNRLEVIV